MQSRADPREKEMAARLSRSAFHRWQALAAALALCLAAERGAQGQGPAAPATAPLEETYWKLVELRGEPAVAAPNQTKPHLVLRLGERPSARGSGGCNRFFGGFRVAGETIAFERVASTMMACGAGMEQEQLFLTALGAAKTWTIEGQTLLLRDAEGKPLARFEARPPK